MAKVKFEDGTVIKFNGIPSSKEIEEAYNNVKGVKTQTTAKEPSKSPYTTKLIPQFITGLAESLPFGKRISEGGRKLPSGIPLEKFPEPQGVLPTFARGLGETAFDLAMSAPFMKGAGLIPKIPGIAKTALGLGAYSGTKAAIQGQPVGQAAMSGAGTGALFHGAGRLGATTIPRSIPFSGRIGSALGGGIAGQIVGGRKGMALGAGLGALHPSKSFLGTEGANKIAETAINNMLRPKQKYKEFGKSPARAIVREGIWGYNLNNVKQKVDMRLNELNRYKDRLKFQAKNEGVTVDLAKNKVFKPIHDIIIELRKAPESHKSIINQLEIYLKDIFTKDNKFRKLNKITIDDAYEIRDIVNNLKPTGIFTRQSEHMVSKALHKTYHNIVEAINNSGISKDLKQTNTRMADLIASKQAINDALNTNPRGWSLLWLPLISGSLSGGLLGSPIKGAIIGSGVLASETPIGATTLSRYISQKYPKVPKK